MSYFSLRFFFTVTYEGVKIMNNVAIRVYKGCYIIIAIITLPTCYVNIVCKYVQITAVTYIFDFGTELCALEWEKPHKTIKVFYFVVLESIVAFKTCEMNRTKSRRIQTEEVSFLRSLIECSD